MEFFVAGLALFFVPHFFTATPLIRRKLVGVIGDNAWRGLLTLCALAGWVLVGKGWSNVPNTLLFAPKAWAVQLAPILVSIGLVLFVIGGANLRGYIKHVLGHPMLVGVVLWSGVHLLANGGWRETVLFGSFLLFSLYALCSLLLAGKRLSFVPDWKRDAIGVGVGLVVAIGVMHGHKGLFGVAVS